MEFFGPFAEFRKTDALSPPKCCSRHQFLASPQALLNCFLCAANYFAGAANYFPLPLTFE
jgi:hypothetical protein